jgi:acyl carrier protein
MSGLTATVTTIVQAFSPLKTEHVQPDDDLETELGYKSLALAELSFALEDLFGLEPVDPDEAITLRTVAAICAHLQATSPTTGLLVPKPDEVATYLGRYASD